MSATLTAACAAALVLVASASAGRRRPRPPGRSRRPDRWPRRGSRPASGAAALAAVLDDLGREVRAGRSLGGALASRCVGAPAPPAPLVAVAQRHQRGVVLAEAARPLADAPDPSLALAGATLCALARCGGASGRALDAAAAALRERAALAADVRAQAATARLSAVVLVLLPVAFAAWTVAGNAAARRFLFASRGGAVVAAAGVALDVAGAWWMRRLIRATVVA
jgi:tight adherence protein B